MPNDEPRWIPAEFIVETNQQEVLETGEPHFLRDAGLLDNACARPINRWHYAGEQDVVRLATALLWGIAKGHPFAQGNKRTAAVAAITFLEANGYRWTRGDDLFLGELITGLVSGYISEEDFAERIRPFVRPVTGALPL